MIRHANVALFVPHEGCAHQCAFCNQKTISGQRERLTPEAVEQALQKAVSDGVNPESTEIAFFGGSFTCIERAYQRSLLEAAKPFLDKKLFSGIRISTRPDAITPEILAFLDTYKVKVIELGAQSMDDGVLRKSGRGHTAADVVSASRLIREGGFSLGLQMMTGLPGDTPEKAKATAEAFIALQPDCVRIYPTVVLTGTPLYRDYCAGLYTPQSLSDAVTLCASLLERFREESIPVIRLGLHAGGDVAEGYAAGPYHPAFGELCESAIYLKKARRLFSAYFSGGKSTGAKPVPVTFFLNEREISKFCGQKGQNRQALLRDGFAVSVKSDKAVQPGEIRMEIHEFTETEIR